MTKLNKYTIFLFAFILASISTIELFGLNEQNQLFNNLKVKDGLPSNEIYKIAQDSNGFMWFATNNGFVRYDGYEMKTFRKNREGKIELPNNQITAIENAKGLGLWLASYGGLMYFDSKTSNSKLIDLGGDREIRCLLNQGDSIIWAGTSEGLFKIQTSDLSYTIFSQQNSTLGSNIIRSLYLDRNKNIWIGTFNGMNELTNSGEMLFFDLKGNYKPELKNNLILDIQPYYSNNDSLLWCGTETGLVLFNTYNENFKVYNLENSSLENEVVKCIFTKTPGEVYVGTDFGFYFIDTYTNEIQSSFHDMFNNYSIANNVVWDIFEDTAGILWLATSNGISKLNFNQSMFRFTPIYSTHQKETIGTQVNDLYSDKNGTIWLATKKGVIALLKNGEKKSFTANSHSNALVLNNINTINGDYKGRIWIGSAGGINVWDPSLKKMNTITANFDLNKGLRSNYISAFITPPDGSFWVITWGGGMYKAQGDFNDVDNITFEYVTNFNTNIYSTHKKIWLKHENQIYSIDLITKKIETINSLNHQVAAETITSLCASSKGILWIGTHNLLISYNINSGELNEYNVITGNDSDILNLLEDHNGNIWGTTLTSIFKFTTSSNSVETFPGNKGIPLDNFLSESKTISIDGKLYFGGNDGFISFNPNEISKNNFNPNTHITSLKVNNLNINSLSELGGKNNTEEQVTYHNKISLKYDQHSFSVGFSSLHYGEPDRNIYAYQLEGYDEDWLYTSGVRNYASYSNLSSGKYLFKVRGTNNDGVWFNNTTTLNIVVKPPYWASPIAIVIYILILQLTTILLIITYRNKVKWKEKIKLITLEKEKNEELAKAKQQFFTNISHEFRTPLSLILGPVESILKNNKLKGHDNQMLNLISKNALRLLSLVNQLLDIRKIETNTLELKQEDINVIELCQKQFNLFIDHAENQHINFKFKAASKSIEIITDVTKLESIIQNLLSNAFKYTPQNGTIILSVETNELNSFKIQVSDSGKGIDPEIREHVFIRFFQGKNPSIHAPGYGIGLNIAKEYCDLMQGKIWFESDLGKGTHFYVELPLNKSEVQIPTSETIINEPVNFEIKTTKPVHQTYNFNNNLPLLLLVDDHPDTIEFLQLNLADSYSILTANNGKIAFELLEKNNVDLIISDVMMPVLDGIEFCEKVKQHPRYENTPLILLTAKTLDSQKLEGYRAGTDAYITKPFELELLKAQIKSLISKNHKIDEYIKRNLIIENQQVEVESSDEKLLQETIHYINKHLNDAEINLEKMCKEIGVSHSGLYRKIKAQTGMSLNELIRNIKLKKAAQLIKSGKLSIAEIMYETGFTSHSYFAKCFKKVYKTTPRDYLNSI